MDDFACVAPVTSERRVGRSQKKESAPERVEPLCTAVEEKHAASVMPPEGGAIFGDFAYRPAQKIPRKTYEPVDWLEALGDDAVLGLWKQDGEVRICATTHHGQFIGRARCATVPDGMQSLADKGVEIVATAQNMQCPCCHSDPLKALTVRPNMPFALSVGIDDACRELNIDVACKAEALARIFVEGRYRLWW